MSRFCVYAFLVSLFLFPMDGVAGNEDLSRKFLMDLNAKYLKRPSRDEVAPALGGTLDRLAPQARGPERFQAKFNNCLADHGEIRILTKELLFPWMNAWKKKNFSAFSALLAEKGAYSPLGMKSKEKEEFGGITVENWDFSQPVSLEKKKWKQSLETYLKRFSRVEDGSLEVLTFRASPAMRQPDFWLKEVQVTARMDI